MAETIDEIGPLKKINALEIQSKYFGDSDDYVFKELLHRKILPPDVISVNEFCRRKMDKVVNLINSLPEQQLTLLFYPGIEQKMEWAFNQRKWHMAIVTASECKYAHSVIERSFLKKYINHLVCREDVAFTKPRPTPFLLSMRQLRLSAKDCLIVEDSPTGKKAAQLSGATVLDAGVFHLHCAKNIIPKGI